jgi:hypothetical protein
VKQVGQSPADREVTLAENSVAHRAW